MTLRLNTTLTLIIFGRSGLREGGGQSLTETLRCLLTTEHLSSSHPVVVGAEIIGRYGEVPPETASRRAHDGGRQRRTEFPLLYRYSLTHT